MGRAPLMDQETVRIFRPTGITGPLEAQPWPGGRMLGLDRRRRRRRRARSLAANATVGLNEWPARRAPTTCSFTRDSPRCNAVTAVELAELGYVPHQATALDRTRGTLRGSRQAASRCGGRALHGGTSWKYFLSISQARAGLATTHRQPARAALTLTLEENLRSAQISRRRGPSRCSGAAINLSGLQRRGPVRAHPASQDRAFISALGPLARRSIDESNGCSTIRKSRG